MQKKILSLFACIALFFGTVFGSVGCSTNANANKNLGPFSIIYTGAYSNGTVEVYNYNIRTGERLAPITSGDKIAIDSIIEVVLTAESGCVTPVLRVNGVRLATAFDNWYVTIKSNIRIAAGFTEENTHEFGGYTPISTLSCTTSAQRKRSCQICGEEEIETTAVAMGHKMSTWGAIDQPKCGVSGLEVRYCENSNCGHSETREVAALQHQMGSWSHGDSESWGVVTAASCGVQGLERRERFCGRQGCGHREEQTRVIPALTHAWAENWQETTPAKCTVGGIETRWCLNGCGQTQTQPTAAIGHQMSAWGDYTITQAPTCHVPGSQKRERSCQNTDCTHKEEQTETISTFHEWDDNWAITTPATCRANGVRTRVCTRGCGATETDQISMLEHQWSEWTVHSLPSGTEDDYVPGEERRYCSICGGYDSRRYDV